MNGERMLQFVDTNVIVYAYDATAGRKRVRAREVMDGLWRSGQGCLSIQVLQEFYTAITCKTKLRVPSGTAAVIVTDLSGWRTHSPIAADVLAAIELSQRFQLSYWDAAIIISAQRLGCGVLWSEDLQNGAVYGGVEVRNPFRPPEFVQE